MGMGKRDVIRLCGSMMALDFSRELHRLTCPVLAVCGEKDRANMRAAVQLCERIPQAERMVIPGAGHEVNADAPERLGEALRAFFGGRTTA